MNYQKNTMKFRKNPENSIKRNFDSDLAYNKNILKLK